MRILMVLEAEYPSDERVEKEILSLTDAGFTVTLATYTFQNRPFLEKKDKYEIRRKRISEFLYKSSAASLVLPFYFMFWYRYLNLILKEGGFGFIHIHDLPLSKVGHRLAQRYGLKLICDQHEFYSNWIVRTDHMNTIPGRLIKFFSDWSGYEEKFLMRADLVITVEEPLRRIYIGQVGISPQKIIVVPNTPMSRDFNQRNVNLEISNRYRNKFVLFYAGSIDQIRGLEFVIQAITILKEEIPSLLFVVAGKENKSYSIIKTAEKYGVKDFVDFVGWINRKELPSFIAASHVCFSAPKADNLEVNNAIPTKVYQYALMGKPIIVSEARLMKEFVLQNKLGYSVDFGNVEQLCQVLKELYINRGKEGLNTHSERVVKEYCWEETSLSLVNYYKELTK